MKYVILKKIDNVWYATKNRYTAKELKIIVDKHYDETVDFELINDGECQGLEDGVIIILDDGRELDANGKYLNDDLKLENNDELTHGFAYIGALIISIAWVFTSLTIDMAVLLAIVWGLLVHFVIVPNLNTNKENKKEMELPKDHKPIGMM